MINSLLQMNELDQKVLVKQALAQLNPRLQLLAYRRFFQNQTLASVADELGISNGRAFQLEAKLLRKLKQGLNSGRM